MIRCRSLFWDLATLLSFLFWQVTSSKLVVRAWICCATCSASILCYEVLFCHLRKMALNDQHSHGRRQTDDAKNHQVEDLVSLDGRSCSGSCLRSKHARKLEKEVPYIGVVFAKNTLMLKSERKRMMSQEKMTWSNFWVSICVYLWIMLFPSFIVVFPSLWMMNFGIYGQHLVCHE